MGLMLWGAWYGFFRRGKGDPAVPRNFWIRFGVGYALFALALTVDPAIPLADALIGLVFLTGVGVLGWGVAFGARRVGRRGRGAARGSLTRAGVGIALMALSFALVPFVSTDEPEGGSRQAAAAPATPLPDSPAPVPIPPESSPVAPAGAPRDAQQAVVVSVDDGDELQLAAHAAGTILPSTDAVRVRLLNIEATDPGECSHQESVDHLRELAPVGSTVWVRHDQRPQDQEGRFLLHVWNDSGVFTNKSMVADGFAQAQADHPNTTRWSEIAAEQHSAQARSVGVWAECPYFGAPESGDPSPKPRPNPEPDPRPSPEPSPAETSDSDSADESGSAYYRNCTAAKNAGVAPLHRGEPGYGSHLDRDGDGTACES
ncbi:thermonuclease family protein [Saccharopolyspora gloriosae]|uniref:Endonuclease YncB(Thermonuclease family) n=1 Tax=Saccharopolyspora gloriosae TaxID=455344 RepID=A0A840NH19_9PSEU|nr:thermonuclease family protein [Saccharopolyspora gloriosae]MBB5067567.1 endonuclease YncB(thermonuclease family) [Saccharopolyspora gloriosae]